MAQTSRIGRGRRGVLLVALILAVGAGLTGAAPAGAVTGGSPVTDGTRGFVAKVDVGGVRACTGALVAPQWILTATSCFAVTGTPVTAGPPPAPTSVTIGRADLTSTAGRVLPAVHVLPHPGRDVALVKLSVRPLDIAPVAVTSGVPAAGDAVEIAGFGRTATEWIPTRLHAAQATVDSVSAGTLTWAGGNATACKGDAGGPVLRLNAGQPELVALNVSAWPGGCLAETDTRRGAIAARVDDLKAWISGNTPALSATWGTYFSSRTGIGTYDLATAADQVVPFDYNHTGKLDHLVLYRPGSRVLYIVRHDADGGYTPVFSSHSGIATYDLASPADRVIAFDYNRSGKQDHLLLYRPGSKVVYILRHNADGTFAPVFSSHNGIGTFDLATAADQIVPFDHDHSGRLDHLLLYRPGTKIAYIVKHNADGSFAPVFSSRDGIGSYDLASTADRVVAFDQDHTGKLDHLLLYRPGSKVAYIVKHNADGSFAPVFSSRNGIGTFDLATAADQILPFDYDHTGNLDHLLLYRPGSKIAYIVKHNADGSFAPVFSSTNGIGGYDLAVTTDRVVAFDYEHVGTQQYLVLYRPGHKTIWMVGRRPAG